MDLLLTVKHWLQFLLQVCLVALQQWPPWRPISGCPRDTVDAIPGPLTLPLLGTQWIYWTSHCSFSQIHQVYRTLHQLHGPILKEESFLNTPIISLMARDDIEKVLKSAGKYPIRPPTEVLAYYRRSRPERYASGGLVNEQGVVWHRLRTELTAELVSPRTIAGFVPQLGAIGEDLCNLLRVDRGAGGVVGDLKPYAERLGLEASCALVLGRRMGFLYEEGVGPDAVKLAEEVRQHFLACRDTYYGLPLWKLFPTPTYRRLVKSEDDIYTLALKLVASADEEARESAVFQSIINSALDEREKTAAIVDFIVAGIYTLGNTLVFVLSLLGRHPDVQDKLYADLQSGSTHYLKACINEAFRLLPTAFILARVTEQDLHLGGYFVGKGAVVLCQMGLACRVEENFREAHAFRPERWLGAERAETVGVATYLVAPFGVGKRMCPGRRFVEQSLMTLVATMVRQFRIACPHELELEFEFILAPKGPVPVVFTDRD